MRIDTPLSGLCNASYFMVKSLFDISSGQEKLEAVALGSHSAEDFEEFLLGHASLCDPATRPDGTA